MNIGPVVEVAIGIIFVWVVLSLATIQIQEWVNIQLKRRATDLEKTIRGMLASPKLKAQFYDHPIIRGLTAKNERLPSYIPSQQFALSLFDIAMTAGTESSLIQQGLYSVRNELEAARGKNRNQAAIDALNALVGLARSAAATQAGTAITNASLDLLKKQVDDFSEQYPQYKPAIDAALKEVKEHKSDIEKVLEKWKAREDVEKDTKKVTKKGAEKDTQTEPDPAIVQLRRGAAALSVISPELNQTLNVLLQNVEDYVTQGETQLGVARKNVEMWFDDAMDRLSGDFKRYSQWVALIIGFLVALILNVDSIDLTLYLWREPVVRQALADNATKFQLSPEQQGTTPDQALQYFRSQFAGLSLPIGWGINDVKGASLSNPRCQLFPDGKQVFGIPIPLTNKCIAPPQVNQSNILVKLSGILMTAIAACQGAPFWFDILKKVVNLRSTGANPVEKEAK